MKEIPMSVHSTIPAKTSTHTRLYGVLAVVLLLAASCAVLHLGPGKIIATITTGKLPALDALLIREFRLPRLLMAMMVGSGMALAGWTAQKVTRNPLASPDILAVPAAAGLGVMVLLLLTEGQMLKSQTVPLVAAGSGTLAAALLFTLVGRKRHLDGSGFLLVGIAMGCLMHAATLLISLNAPSGLNTYAYAVNWMSGQLSRASWDYVSAAAAGMVAVVPGDGAAGPEAGRAAVRG